MSMSDRQYDEFKKRFFGGGNINDDRDIEGQLKAIEATIAFLRSALEEQKEIVRLKAEFIEHQKSEIESLRKSVAFADELNISLVRMNAPRQ